jgi:hypothetical protein
MGSQFQLLSGFLTLILPFKKKRKKHLTEALYPRADSTIAFIFARCIVATVTYLVDEELHLDDGGSALMLTVALHTWPAEPERHASSRNVPSGGGTGGRLHTFLIHTAFF